MRVTIRPTNPDVRAGDVVELELAIDTDEPVHADGIRITVAIWEGWRIGSGKTARGEERRVLDEEFRVPTPDPIPAGHTTLRRSVTIPADCPPTHDTTPAFCFARVQGFVDHGWRCPTGSTWWLDIRRPTHEVIVRQPAVHRSPLGDLEVSIASTRLARGEPVIGWVNAKTPHRSDLPVEVGLDATTTLVSRAKPERYPWRRRTFVIPAGLVDHAMPFELLLPATMPPTFSAGTQQRAWSLVCRAPGGLLGRGPRVEIPLEVVDPAVAPPQIAADAPALGSEPLAATFAAFAAARQWQQPAQPLALREYGLMRPWVTRVDGSVELEIGCVYVDGEGFALASRARFPALGLGLSVERSSWIRELLTSDVEAGVPAWDRTHHVEATNPAGAAAHLRRVVPVLVAATSLGALVHWSDTTIEFLRPIEWVEADELAKVASELTLVARTNGPEGGPVAPYR